MHELLINNKISFIALSEQRPLSSSPLVLGHLVRYQTQLGIKGPRGNFGPKPDLLRYHRDMIYVHLCTYLIGEMDCGPHKIQTYYIIFCFRSA